MDALGLQLDVWLGQFRLGFPLDQNSVRLVELLSRYWLRHSVDACVKGRQLTLGSLGPNGHQRSSTFKNIVRPLVFLGTHGVLPLDQLVRKLRGKLSILAFGDLDDLFEDVSVRRYVHRLSLLLVDFDLVLDILKLQLFEFLNLRLDVGFV